MSGGPRRWRNILDTALTYGMFPARADRCCYVLSSEPYPGQNRASGKGGHRPRLGQASWSDDAVEYLTDPLTGHPTHGVRVECVINLYVADLFGRGTE